jgi:hypothetical protein
VPEDAEATGVVADVVKGHERVVDAEVLMVLGHLLDQTGCASTTRTERAHRTSPDEHRQARHIGIYALVVLDARTPVP